MLILVVVFKVVVCAGMYMYLRLAVTYYYNSISEMKLSVTNPSLFVVYVWNMLQREYL